MSLRNTRWICLVQVHFLAKGLYSNFEDGCNLFRPCLQTGLTEQGFGI